MKPLQRRGLVVAAVAFAFVSLAAAAVAVRAAETFNFFIFAVDAKEGQPVLDLTAADVSMKEEAGEGKVLGIRRFGWPLKVTILIDNGARTNSWLIHTRSGIEKFIKATPPEVAISIITTAPAPRFLARDIKDREVLLKAVPLIVAESEDGGAYGRFADSLTEYARRLDDEFRAIKGDQLPPYLPVLIVISNTMQDGSLVRKEDSITMILSLQKHRVWTNFVMINPSKPASFGGELTVEPDEAQVAELANAVQKNTNGRYFALGQTGSSALSTTLLPDLAKDVVVRYIKQMTQHEVVIERAPGATGPIKNLSVGVTRAGVKLMGLSLDGNMP